MKKPPEGGYQGVPSNRSPKLPEDNLTRIGNFLGGSNSAIMRLAEQRTGYLRQIAANTSHSRPNPDSRSTRNWGMIGPLFVPTH